MATIDRSTIEELMQRGESLDLGPTRVAVFEEAVRLADMLADVPLGYQARTRLIDAAQFSGAPEKSMVAFSWCLAQFDRDPTAFDERTILWEYKWVIGSLASFPQISREKIEQALADFTRRVERAGFGMRPILKLRYRAALDMGDLDEANKAYARWVKSPRGMLSDCSACDLDDEVEYLAGSGRDEEAFERARPILNGSMRCRVVPHVTLAKLLLPLVRLGRLAEAAAIHLKGYRLISRNRDHIVQTGKHIQFLALTDNLAKGVKLFESHLPWALETNDPSDRFGFVLRTKILFDRLRASGKDTIRLRLPQAFPRFEESGQYATADLASWLESDAVDLARRFDRPQRQRRLSVKDRGGRRTGGPGVAFSGQGLPQGRNGRGGLIRKPGGADFWRPPVLPGRNLALHFSRFLAKLQLD